MHPRLPNDRESALSMSCSERGRAGKACTYVSETASGHGALRGTSRHIGDHAGEGVPPRPHRDLPPSITPSKEAVAGDESSRAIVSTTPTGAGALKSSSIVAPAASLDLTWFLQSTSFSDLVVIVRVFFSRATARSALTVGALRGSRPLTICLDARANGGSH